MRFLFPAWAQLMSLLFVAAAAQAELPELDKRTDHPLFDQSALPPKFKEMLNETPNTSALTLYKGILAPPGSPARIKGGEVLESQLNAFYSTFAFSEEPVVRSEQELTRKVFQLTIDYMKGSGQCASSEKLRLYRGIGKQPLIRPPGDNSGGFQIFMDPMVNLMTGLGIGQKIYKDSHISQCPGVDAGELAHYYLDDLALKATRPFDWASLLDRRKIFTTVAGLQWINLRFDYLAAAHTVSSEESPLISATINADQPKYYGAVTQILDVCPERVLPSNQRSNEGSYMAEAEFYVPLVTFPEETVRTVGIDCFRPDAQGRVGGIGCGFEDVPADSEEEEDFEGDPDRYAFADADPVTPQTAKLRRMFLMTGHSYEPIFFAEVIRAAAENIARKNAPVLEYSDVRNERYYKLQDEYYALLKNTKDLKTWRQEIKNFKPVPDCKVAQAIVDDSVFAAEMYQTRAWPSGTLNEVAFQRNQKRYQDLKPQILAFLEDIKEFCPGVSLKPGQKFP